MIKIGVTGSRNGMSDEQMKKFIDILSEIGEVVELHHGDCVGVDVQAAIIAGARDSRSAATRVVHRSNENLPRSILR